VRTTVADPAHSRAPDLVKRNFTAQRPGELHVADFTYVPLDGGGFGYTAFVIDAFAGLIAGWECSLSKQTAFVEKAIRQAAALRARQGHPIGGAAIHHSDAGSQYTSVRFAQTLLLAGLTGSVGSVGDAYDNALAETTIGLYKTECIRSGSPFRNGPLRTLADLEEVTSIWVHWYNNERLMHAWDAGHPPKLKPGTGRGRNTWLDVDPRGGPPSVQAGSGSKDPAPGKATALRPMSSHVPPGRRQTG